MRKDLPVKKQKEKNKKESKIITSLIIGDVEGQTERKKPTHGLS